MTAAPVALERSPAEAEFGEQGTIATPPDALLWPRKVVARIVLVGCAATSATMMPVTSADAVALSTAVARPSTLPGAPAAPETQRVDRDFVPALLRRLHRISGLSWADIGRAIGVTRRTVHNWMGGARVAGPHLSRIIEVGQIIEGASTGSAQSTRAALLSPGATGRSMIDDLELGSRPRRRPISSVSVGEQLTPVAGEDEAADSSRLRPSGLKGRPVGRRARQS